jgi:Skp family chaperone for outer membrane proteins
MASLNRSWRIAALAVATALAFIPAVHAQTARGGGGSANAQVLQQLQQLGSERTALQTENTRLKSELDALQAGQKNLGARERASTAAAARTVQERDTAQSELTQQKERMQELIAKFRETAQALRDVETDRTAKTGALATRDRELNSCVDHNLALYGLSGEVLDRLEHQGLWAQLARSEPFTRIKRTQLENLVDDYKQKARDHRVETP